MTLNSPSGFRRSEWGERAGRMQSNLWRADLSLWVVCSGLRNSSERLQEEATPKASPGKRARRGRLSYPIFSSVQLLTRCPTLCNPMDRSTPGLPVHQQFPEFTQTPVHWVRDAIQPSHPLSSPSPTPSWVPLICWSSSQNSGKHFTSQVACFLLKDVTQDEPNREMGQGQGKGVELPNPLPACSSPQISMCSLTRMLSESHLLGVLWRPHYKGMIDYMIGRWWVIQPGVRGEPLPPP